uniref:5'-AMP-activated protein kinase subunit gamma-1 n=2 Tax=Haemonchus contortus TaxID=6289 RepID=A0A7I4YCR0_HAECO
MTSMRQTSVPLPINIYDRAADLESGRTATCAYAQATGNSTACEQPASRVTPPSSQPPSTPSPHSRFIDGLRRRTRLRSLNVPSHGHENLDSDLGFPPVCSPPPPPSDSAGSLPPEACGSRTRRRTMSDAAQTCGLNFNGTNKRHSGVLVIFPHSPSAHGDYLQGHSTPAAGNKRLSSYGSSASKSFEGVLPAASRSIDAQSSPRRPLYVDIPLANGLNEKRKSPVTSVVDFVRGRSRTASLTSSGPATPPSPPALSASARASASTDGGMPLCECRPLRSTSIGGKNYRDREAPLFSPNRGNGRPLLSRMHRPGMRSLDSGLDLSSPTIGHHALFIKETAMFESFDSMTIGSAAADINAVFFDCQDAVYSLFMKAHKCYDLIPTSTKLVVFDTQLPVRKAFFALVYNGVRAAPLWDSEKQRFIGMLTITDFIKILIKHYESGNNDEKLRALEEEQISHWRELFEADGIPPLVTIDPNESLYRAVQVLCESKVHRLPVMDKNTGNISYIITHKRLIKFLSLYLHDLPRPAFMESTPKELGIGSWGDIVTIHVDTPLHDALDIFLRNRVSALPLVDEQGRVVDIYAKFDVISLAAEKSYNRLDCTVQEALKHRSEWFEGVQCCLETDSLFVVVEAIVRAEVHRLIMTDADKKVVGIVSLSDILKFLVLDGAELSGALSAQQSPHVSIDDSPPIEGIPEGVED